ncbi:HAD-IA family hydrolase [Lacimicrobium alkaliphilum]|uniref:Haloacid dehalogenase n=1 Tax=Lacimicrobium alkaliphilum TaxID=1526571 RepID=A0ABQ1RR98_9ALTE|nr:HAD-IA family hydrolase [Lacimicrobium alkaliphilum]GGD78475.1 haloacid dehalogenase [Lacimicrobium alkaliphilum]
MYKLVIFDWDGTLMDSCGRIVSAMRTSARRAGLPVPEEAAVRDIIGISLRPAIARLFGELPEQQSELLFELYRQEYVDNDPTPTPLFGGAIELLEQIRQRQMLMAVATGKARRGLNRVWQQTGTGHFFSASRCGDETRSKPDPDMLEQILAELSVQPHEALMIGDTCYDLHMAEQLGMDRVGVSFGVHETARLRQHKPKVIVDSLAEIAELIL